MKCPLLGAGYTTFLQSRKVQQLLRTTLQIFRTNACVHEEGSCKFFLQNTQCKKSYGVLPKNQCT